MAELYEAVKKRSEFDIMRLRREVRAIIKEEDHSESRVCKALDRMLDHIRMGHPPTEFKLLLKYYAGLEKEKAKTYFERYQKITCKRRK